MSTPLERTTYRILVTGSRTWRDYQAVYDAIKRAADGHQNVVVVHGAARDGADAYADLAARRLGLAVETHPAKWYPRGRDNPIDRGAGFARNERMVALGADVCVAFLLPCNKMRCTAKSKHYTHGASQLERKALDAKIPVTRVTPLRHKNHPAGQIVQWGQCPACDDYHARRAVTR